MRSSRAPCIPCCNGCCDEGWVLAEWRATENNRRARFYRLSASGRRQLDAEIAWWKRAIGGVDKVLRAAAQES